ncbi:MAG: ABC transporter ATP-binding protein [Acidobacteriota bacterium]
MENTERPQERPTVEIRELVKAYGGFRAVDRLSFQVMPGEILGLVGPNGAGKTTALRCMAGILPPTSGRVMVQGFDIVSQRVESRRRLAFVPDEPRLFDYLTSWDYLMVIARLYGVLDGRERAAELLARFDLAEHKNAFPVELSRGMKQKLMIVSALLHRPRLLILDEPLTGLDPAAMRRMKRTILETAGQGVAVVVSSHMLHLVEEIGTHVLILKEGQKLLEGTLEEIRAAIPELGGKADLETLFMRATGEDEAP